MTATDYSSLVSLTLGGVGALAIWALWDWLWERKKKR